MNSHSVSYSRVASAAAIVVFLCFADLGFAQTWSRFRGPNGSGYVSEGQIPNSWTDDDYAWTVEVPGDGIGSPVVMGGKLFVLSADENEKLRHVLAYDLRSGKLLWDKTFAFEAHRQHARNRFASSTPCCDEHHVYAAWSQPDHTLVVCLSHDGQLVWEKDLGSWQSQHGFGTSPIVVDDRVVLFDSQQADQLRPGEKPGVSAMIAMQRDSGEIAWRTEMTTTRVCYGTPCIYQSPDGSRQIIDCNTGDGVFALDVATGKRLWNLKVFAARCCSSPLICGDLIVGTSGSGGGGNHLVAVRPGESSAEEIFRIEKAAPYVPTPVVAGPWLLSVDDKGVASCFDASNGKVQWTRRIGGTVSSSPIVVGNKLLTIDIDGTATVLSASQTFQELGSVELGGHVQATPAFAEGYLLLRAGKRLLALNCRGS